MPNKLAYYNYSRILGYNGTYNFLVGGRGLGKTFGAKKKVFRDAIKKGHEFIYLRRYKQELATARNTFFADIAEMFPAQDFRINGSVAQWADAATRDEKKREWHTMGYFISLSTAQNQKSVAFPKVRTIIFDEFIIERGAVHYLPNEAMIFNNFYSTVDRYQDKTKVFFLANSVSMMNPHFLEYEIRPDEGKEFLVKADGFIVCHFPDSEEFTNSVYETKFGKFIKGTEYADYAVGNTFEDNNENMLRLKDSRSHYRFTIETKNGSFSVWYNMHNDEYFIQEKLPKSQIVYTLVSEKMDTHKMLMTFTDKPLARLRTSFRAGSVWFDTPKTRNTFAEIFKR